MAAVWVFCVRGLGFYRGGLARFAQTRPKIAAFGTAFLGLHGRGLLLSLASAARLAGRPGRDEGVAAAVAGAEERVVDGGGGADCGDAGEEGVALGGGGVLEPMPSTELSCRGRPGRSRRPSSGKDRI